MAVAESHLEHSKTIESLGLQGDLPRKLNIAMIGAGSFFTNSILKDVVLIPGSQGGELRLVDIDSSRLDKAEKLMRVILRESGQDSKWKLITSTDRRSIFPGTDYIINTIEVSGTECVRYDNDIPLEYGISQCIGDTIGPGGLFKALRTVPVWLEILKDAEELCPKALVLNYTNPMNMMCLAAARTSRMEVVGLCHSVQGTSNLLARYADVPYETMKWRCAGINHLAWFTELQDSQGHDLYPILKQKAADRQSEFAKEEPVRTDMMLHFGAFITESSGHLSEYLPYYRTSRELIDTYTDTGYRGEESFYANNWPNWRNSQDSFREKLTTGEEKVELKRSWEYGAWIIEAVEKHQPYVIYGNVANNGLISNLPADGCVEVACLVDRNRIQPTKYGALPRHMAAVCDWNMRMFDVATEACIHKSKEAAFHALLLDPLTAAVCAPAQIKEMTERLFEAEAEFLPGFK